MLYIIYKCYRHNDVIFDILTGSFYFPFKSIVKEGLPREILVTDQQIVPFTCIQLH